MRRPQRPQGYRTEAQALERHDRMTDRFEHAAYLAVPSFVQRQIDDGAISRNCNDLQLHGRRPAAFEKNTAAELLYCFGCEPATQLRTVDFVDAEARMRQRKCEIAVVRQKKYARGIIVETPHRNESCRLRTTLRANDIVDGAPAFRIAHRRDDTDGFVENQHFALRHDDRAAIDLDAIAFLNSRTELANEAAVHANVTGDDQFFRGTSRGDSREREIALQSHGESETRPLSHLLPRA